MIKEYGLAINAYYHFQFHRRESTKDILLLDIDKIMVSRNKTNRPIEPVKATFPIRLISKTEVTKMEHNAILRDCGIPFPDQDIIHLFDALEWPSSVIDNARMEEMGVCGKK